MYCCSKVHCYTSCRCANADVIKSSLDPDVTKLVYIGQLQWAVPKGLLVEQLGLSAWLQVQLLLLQQHQHNAFSHYVSDFWLLPGCRGC